MIDIVNGKMFGSLCDAYQATFLTLTFFVSSKPQCKHICRYLLLIFTQNEIINALRMQQEQHKHTQCTRAEVQPSNQ